MDGIMNYIALMKKKNFIWKAELFLLLIVGSCIQIITALLLGSKAFWMEEIAIIALSVMLCIRNCKYNSLVNNAEQQFCTIEKKVFFRIPQKGMGKTYVCCLKYTFDEKSYYYFTLIDGAGALERFNCLLENEKLPIAVNRKKKKKVLLIQEFFEMHELQGQGIEDECFPINLFVYIPRFIFGLIWLYTRFVY